MSKEKVQPFDSFARVYKLLIWAGYFKLLIKPKNKFKWMCHQIYRPLALLIIVLVNLKHIIFMIQRRDNMEDVFDALMTEIPQMNLLAKFLTLNLQITKVNKINKLINEPFFAAKSPKDEELLLKNQIDMNHLFKYIFVSLTIASILWPASHFGRRYRDPTAVVPCYVPFETDTWGKFSMSVALEVIFVLWIGHGHIAIDFVMSTYYAQAAVQLKIIKYNLEHLFDTDNVEINETFQYKDMMDDEMKSKFVYYVQRFETLAWYIKEVGKIFNPAMSFQLLTSSISLCMVVYKMSSTPMVSLPFVFLIGLTLVYLVQVFLHCYFGNLVQEESKTLVNSTYLSDWTSLSPKFRRMLLIAMTRWSRTLAPTVAGLIPLSLNTFLSILRSTYSLYALLGTMNNK